MVHLYLRSVTFRKMLEMGIIENRKNPRKDHNASFLIKVEFRESVTLLIKQTPP